jgi:hypothetical protein
MIKKFCDLCEKPAPDKTTSQYVKTVLRKHGKSIGSYDDTFAAIRVNFQLVSYNDKPIDGEVDLCLECQAMLIDKIRVSLPNNKA